MRARRKKPVSSPNFDKDGKVNWRKHEKDVVTRSGGRAQPGSGNKPGKPGDTTDQHYMRECKATNGAGITIKSEWLEKLVSDAMSRGMTPLVELRLSGQSPPVPSDWVLIPAIDFEALSGINH